MIQPTIGYEKGTTARYLAIQNTAHVDANFANKIPSELRALLACLVVFTAILTLFAWSSWFWVSWVLFLLVGVISLGMIWTLATTLIQSETPAEVRGRMMAMLQLAPGFHYLGAFPLAMAAGQWGWGVAITGSAVLCLAVTVWFALLRRGAPKMSRQAAREPETV